MARNTADISHLPGSSEKLAEDVFGFHVAIVDGSGNQITTFGGGTQYTEGDADTTITGTALLWEDTSDTLRAVSAAKPLPVNIVSGAGSGGTASTDDAAFTAGAGSGTPAMGFVTSDVVDSGDVGVLRMTATRDLNVTIRDSAGDNAMDDANNALRVNVVAGSAGGPSKTDDSAFTVATDSVSPAGFLADETATDTVDEGDVGIARMDTSRRVLTRIVGATDANRLDIDASGRATVVVGTALPAGTNNIGDVDVLSVPAPLSTTGGGTEASALRVTVANDSTGVLSVDDNGGSLTVDGTVAVSGTVTVDSELPTAAALADDTANPTVPGVGAFGMVYDGTTWDRLRGTSADGMLVNLGANNDVTVTSGSITVVDGGSSISVDDNGSTLSIDDGSGSITVDNAALSVTGGGVEASALRVTIANDSTGVLSVDDNGGSITVDGTVTANAGTGTFTAGGVAAHDAAVSGNPVLGAGRASTATPTAVSADGDVVYAWHDRQGAYKTAIVDDAGDSVMDGTNNAVRVNIVAGAGSGGTASTDDAAFTAGSGSGTPMMGFATSDAVDSGDVGVVRMTTTRDLMVTLRDSAGDSAMDDANDAVRVNVVAGSAGGPSKTDDAAFTIATDSVAPMGALVDETTPDSADEGDVGIPRMTADRKLLVRVVGATDGNRLDIDASGRPTVNVNGTVTVDSELPTAAALADNTANPTVPAVGSFLMGFDGTNWDRVRADGGSVFIQDGGNSITVDGTVSISGTVDTELPTAAALADNTSNPTVPGVGAFGMVWDGATWDRMAGTSADGVTVNLGANNDVTVTGTVTANQGTAGTAWEVVGDVAQDAAIAGNPLPTGLRASDTEPTAMSADGDAVYAWGDRSGRFVTTQKCGSTAQSSVAGSASSVSLLASNVARLGAVINNDSTAILYVKLGATASTTSYTYKLYTDGVCEIPYGYTGAVDGIWSSATGNARITEMS